MGSKWELVGLVAGAVVIVLGIICLVICLCRRRDAGGGEHQEKQPLLQGATKRDAQAAAAQLSGRAAPSDNWVARWVSDTEDNRPNFVPLPDHDGSSAVTVLPGIAASLGSAQRLGSLAPDSPSISALAATPRHSIMSISPRVTVAGDDFAATPNSRHPLD